MIDIHSKYDNMHKNVIFYVLICINNHVNSCINCMLLDMRATSSLQNGSLDGDKRAN